MPMSNATGWSLIVMLLTSERKEMMSEAVNVDCIGIAVSFGEGSTYSRKAYDDDEHVKLRDQCFKRRILFPFQ